VEQQLRLGMDQKGEGALPPADETGVLAVELGAAYGRMVNSCREFYAVSPEEARQMADEASPEQLARVLNGPPGEVTWFDLDTLARHDPALAMKRWVEIQQAARQELRTGHRAAQAIECADRSDCQSRAGFLALRADLIDAWQPRNAQDLQLIDQLAQWQTLMWFWQDILSTSTNMQLLLCRAPRKRRVQKQLDSNPPRPEEVSRLSQAEAMESATRMVERYHRLYLRTLDALRAGRSQPGVVSRAEQVNLGHQPVNFRFVAQSEVMAPAPGTVGANTRQRQNGSSWRRRRS
jgi:hypothetical protein